MTTLTVPKKDVAFLVTRTFPNYTGRKFRIVPAETVTLHDVNWGDGSRNQYRVTALSLDAESVKAVPAPAPWANPYEGAIMPIPQGWAVVEHSIFCGKDCGIRIHVNPLDVARGFLGKVTA